jgi:uncharacterized alkaline shock family protein YloU
MKGVDVEQVEETKSLAVTLDCKLSWSKHIYSIDVEMETSVGNKEMLCFYDITLQVLQAPVLSHCD